MKIFVDHETYRVRGNSEGEERDRGREREREKQTEDKANCRFRYNKIKLPTVKGKVLLYVLLAGTRPQSPNLYIHRVIWLDQNSKVYYMSFKISLTTEQIEFFQIGKLKF